MFRSSRSYQKEQNDCHNNSTWYRWRPKHHHKEQSLSLKTAETAALKAEEVTRGIWEAHWLVNFQKMGVNRKHGVKSHKEMLSM